MTIITPHRHGGLSLALAVLLVVVAGLGLRIYGLDGTSLWIDEAYSAWFSSRTWGYLWTEVPQFETHPPFYYSILKLWRVFGDGETALRLLSVLLNVATIPFVALTAYLCGTAGDRRGAAVLAAMFFALSHTQLQASQDARPYALMSLAMAITLASAVAVLRRPDRAAVPIPGLMRRDRPMAAAYAGVGIGMALLAWSHNYGPVIAVLIGLCLFVWWLTSGMTLSILAGLLLSAALAVVLYIPNIPIILMQLETMGGEGFWLSRPGLASLARVVLSLPFDTIPGRVVIGPLVLLGALSGLWIMLSRRRSSPDAPAGKGDGMSPAIPILLLVTMFGPVAISFVLSRIGQPVFLFRTLQASQIPLLVALAFAPSAALVLWGRRMQIGVGAAALCVAAISALSYLVSPGRGPAEDWRGMTQAIAAASDDPRPTIVLVPTEPQLSFLYYGDRLDIPLDLVTVPEPYPAIGSAYRYPAGGGGAPGITPDMIPDLDRRLSDEDEVWYVHRNQRVFDPDLLVARYLERTFPCLIAELPPAAEHRRRTQDDGTCAAE